MSQQVRTASAKICLLRSMLHLRYPRRPSAYSISHIISLTKQLLVSPVSSTLRPCVDAELSTALPEHMPGCTGPTTSKCFCQALAGQKLASAPSSLQRSVHCCKIAIKSLIPKTPTPALPWHLPNSLQVDNAPATCCKPYQHAGCCCCCY